MATKKKPAAPLALEIKRPTKGVELCLDLSLRAEWEQAEAELREAKRDPSVDQRMTGGPVTDLSRRITELEEQMAAQTVTFTLQALPRRAWSDLRTEHPPRPDDAGDKALGMNEATFFDPAIIASIVAVTGTDGAEVEWDPERWGPLADEMTTRQYEDFKIAVIELNLGASARLPKSLAASLAMARTVES